LQDYNIALTLQNVAATLLKHLRDHVWRVRSKLWEKIRSCITTMHSRIWRSLWWIYCQK